MLEAHYNADYFRWQEQQGEFSGQINVTLYQPHVKLTDKVIDFGCGGGFILNQLICGEKMGIEINETARARAEKHGFAVKPSLEEAPDGWADVIISNSVLEHVRNPLEIIEKLKSKLRPGGLFICVVPHEKTYPYFPNDVNQHIYTWSPMCAGNMFSAAGYEVISSKSLHFLWPPFYRTIYKTLGLKAYLAIQAVYARLIYPVYFPLYMRLRYGYPVNCPHVKVVARKV